MGAGSVNPATCPAAVISGVIEGTGGRVGSVRNGSNPLVRFRVRVRTGTEPWQRFYCMKNPDRWHLGRFPPQTPAIASPGVSLQLSI
jgi:hypothetical protein